MAKVAPATAAPGCASSPSPSARRCWRDLRSRIPRSCPRRASTATPRSPRTRRIEATRALSARPLTPLYDFSQADIVLSLDARLPGEPPRATSPTRASSPPPRPEEGALNRLYMAEHALLHHRRHGGPPPAREVRGHPRGGRRRGPGRGWPGRRARRRRRGQGARRVTAEQWIAAVASDLTRAAGRSLVVAGERQPAAVHALAHAINAALGNVGQDGALRRRPPPTSPGLAGSASWWRTSRPARWTRWSSPRGTRSTRCPRTRGWRSCWTRRRTERAKLTVHLHLALRGRDLRTARTGSSPRRTSWRRGAMAARWTARCPSPSRSSQPLFNGMPESELLALFLGRALPPGLPAAARLLARPVRRQRGLRVPLGALVSVGIVPGTTAAPWTRRNLGGRHRADQRVQARRGAGGRAVRDQLRRPTTRSSTAASPTSPGCRSCPTPSPSSSGTTRLLISPKTAERAERRARRRGGGRLRRPQAAGPGVDHAGPRGRRGDDAAGLRPHRPARDGRPRAWATTPT